MEMCSDEAVKYVWEGAIPLQIHLHESEVTTLPPPSPILEVACFVALKAIGIVTADNVLALLSSLRLSKLISHDV